MSHEHRVIRADQLQIPPGSGFQRLMPIGLAVGVIAAIASFVLGSGEKQLYFSWLVAFLFFLSIALGGLFFVLIHYATKSSWGVWWFADWQRTPCGRCRSSCCCSFPWCSA